MWLRLSLSKPKPNNKNPRLVEGQADHQVMIRLESGLGTTIIKLMSKYMLNTHKPLPITTTM